MAIKRAFGDHAYKLAVSSTKSMTGHLLGGAGGLEAGITRAGDSRSDRAADHESTRIPIRSAIWIMCRNHARPMKIDYALSNSFGFGGTNGCLIFKRYSE